MTTSRPPKIADNAPPLPDRSGPSYAQSDYGRIVSGGFQGFRGSIPGGGATLQIFSGAEAAFAATSASDPPEPGASTLHELAAGPKASDFSSIPEPTAFPSLAADDQRAPGRSGHKETKDQLIHGSLASGAKLVPLVTHGESGSDVLEPTFSGKPLDDVRAPASAASFSSPPTPDLTGIAPDVRAQASGDGRDAAPPARERPFSPGAPPWMDRSKPEITKSSESKEVPDTLVSDSVGRLDAKYLPSIEYLIYTGTGNATLVGNSLDNTLVGNTGNDTLTGGVGNDHLFGGTGDDVFVFGLRDGVDQILDFSEGDRLQFKGMHTLAQVSVTQTDAGQEIRFGETVVELLGVRGLVASTDWIIGSH